MATHSRKILESVFRLEFCHSAGSCLLTRAKVDSGTIKFLGTLGFESLLQHQFSILAHLAMSLNDLRIVAGGFPSATGILCSSPEGHSGVAVGVAAT